MSTGGRVVIPAEYRKALGLSVGDEVVLMLEEGAVRMMTPKEAVARAQRLVSRFVSGAASMADELMAERRAEHRAEAGGE